MRQISFFSLFFNNVILHQHSTGSQYIEQKKLTTKSKRGLHRHKLTQDADVRKYQLTMLEDYPIVSLHN